MFDSTRTLSPPVCDPYSLLINYTILILLINSIVTKTHIVIFSLNPNCTYSHSPNSESLSCPHDISRTTRRHDRTERWLVPYFCFSSFVVWETMELLKAKAYILWPKNTSNLFDTLHSQVRRKQLASHRSHFNHMGLDIN